MRTINVCARRDVHTVVTYGEIIRFPLLPAQPAVISKPIAEGLAAASAAGNIVSVGRDKQIDLLKEYRCTNPACDQAYVFFDYTSGYKLAYNISQQAGNAWAAQAEIRFNLIVGCTRRAHRPPVTEPVSAPVEGAEWVMYQSEIEREPSASRQVASRRRAAPKKKRAGRARSRALRR